MSKPRDHEDDPHKSCRDMDAVNDQHIAIQAAKIAELKEAIAPFKMFIDFLTMSVNELELPPALLTKVRAEGIAYIFQLANTHSLQIKGTKSAHASSPDRNGWYGCGPSAVLKLSHALRRFGRERGYKIDLGTTFQPFVLVACMTIVCES